jgi:5-formyltetrahydrofolate cyclo-ligase
MEKQRIREQMRQQRMMLSYCERSKKSGQICSLLQKQDVFLEAKNILFFAPAFGEPDILPLAEKFFTKKNIFFPKILPLSVTHHHKSKERCMTVKKVHSFECLEKGAFGILEPKDHLSDSSPNHLDLVLVPALAIDFSGNRLGFGGGYYDRFLYDLRVQKCAVIYDFQLFQSLLREPHDVPVDAFVTEFQFFFVNGNQKK